MTALSVAAKPSPAGVRPSWRWHDRRWWLAAALTAGGAALIPWLVLATCVPAITRAWHWSASWTGLDGLEAVGLLGTGVLLLRKDARYRLTAAATAALLLADAWFDITTSAAGPGLVRAITMAVCLELPVAVVCAALAARRPATRLCRYLVDRAERRADLAWLPCRDRCGIFAGENAADGR